MRCGARSLPAGVHVSSLHRNEREAIWIGIDLGTQSVRATAVSQVGDVLGCGSHPLTSWRKDGRHEQDPEQWWLALACACRVALAGLPSAQIRGVAVGGTSGTILLINQSGRPLTPALMYDDARAGVEAERANQPGRELWDTLGYRMQPSWALPKLLWLIRTHHRLIPYARLAHQSDFINSRLAGQLLPSDWSNALKTGYDLLQETWPGDVFDALGIPDHLLPEVVRSGTQIGVVCQHAAEITGIPAGTPISAGMTDGCAAQIGAGALQPGDWNSVLGTTLVLKGVTRRLLRDPQGALYCHRSPDGDWLPGGASSTGAGVLAKEFPGRDLAALSARAAERGPATVVRYPLISRGERFPFIAPDAEGFCLGDPADEVDRFAALLEGVAFIERLCFDYLDMLGAPLNGNLSFTGGGARNRYWRQLRADVLGRAVRLPQNSEPAFGMAVLAAAAGRRLSDVAREMVGTAEGIEPQPHNSDHFCESYLRLVHELERRGWLHPDLAAHATARCASADTSIRAIQ